MWGGGCPALGSPRGWQSMHSVKARGALHCNQFACQHAGLNSPLKVCPQTTRSLSSRGCQGPRPCLRGPSGLSPASSLAPPADGPDPGSARPGPAALHARESPLPSEAAAPGSGTPVPPRSRSGAPAEQGRSAPHAHASLFAHELRRRGPRRSCRCYLPPSTSTPRSPSRDASEHTTTSPYVLTPQTAASPASRGHGPCDTKCKDAEGSQSCHRLPGTNGLRSYASRRRWPGRRPPPSPSRPSQPYRSALTHLP